MPSTDPRLMLTTSAPFWHAKTSPLMRFQADETPSASATRATTKREVVAPEVPPVKVLRERHPRVKVEEALLVDDGAVVTGGGVALCIDTTLHLLERTLGARVAAETARILEYGTARAANAARSFDAVDA